MKGYRYRYYVRMREIEYTAYLINRVALGGLYGAKEISAPRIDMTWGSRATLSTSRIIHCRRPHRGGGACSVVPGKKPEEEKEKQKAENPDWRADEPERRDPQKIYRDLGRCYWWPNVVLPHALAVILGLLLFIAFALNASGVDHLRL